MNKKLKAKRDDLLDDRYPMLSTPGLGNYNDDKRAGYYTGFNACYAELAQTLEKVRGVVKVLNARDHDYDCRTNIGDNSCAEDCDCFILEAQAALAELNEILGDT